MTYGTFSVFKIGIGPSSSHTVGPMRAALRFAQDLKKSPHWEKITAVSVELFGSLGSTGVGHGSDRGIIWGLEGQNPSEMRNEKAEEILNRVKTTGTLLLLGEKVIPFDSKASIIFYRRKSLPYHPNALRFQAYLSDENSLFEDIYYSTGGGFILSEKEAQAKANNPAGQKKLKIPFEFSNASELLDLCRKQKKNIFDIMLANEKVFAAEKEIYRKLDLIWSVMNESIDAGCRHNGILPGKLKVIRRAPELYKKLIEKTEPKISDPLLILDWVNLYAIAVNEENAAGARVVSAPTNGAAGIIPAVIRYYNKFVAGSSNQGIRDFLLTAAAIGCLYLKNASISGAEVGCQGEVGVACSMAAGGLAAALGGDAGHIEQAAEIAMEHNLGLTCDPIGGLVQIPCIERNAMGAVKAINAARIAMSGNGKHYVSLDTVIATMKKTGADMKTKYKETARGGLAVNMVEC